MFADSQTREVGGEVTGVEELREDGVYFVKRDINVRPGQILGTVVSVVWLATMMLGLD